MMVAPRSDESTSTAALTRAAAAASLDWGFAPSAADSAIAALPTELLGALGAGLREGTLVINGTRFALP